MELFKFIKNTYEIEVMPEVVKLKPFADIIKRNKSNHDLTHKELSLIYFYADIRSDYMYIIDEAERLDSIIKDLKLPIGYKLDKPMVLAIEFYREKSTTVLTTIYEAAYIAACGIAEYIKGAKDLLNDGDVDIAKITSAIEKVPKIMSNLKAAKKEIIDEQKELTGRSKGSKEMNMFEGLNMSE
jgi:hypothetical protein